MEKKDILKGLRNYHNDNWVKFRKANDFLDLCVKETEETLNKETDENLNYWANLEELTRFIEFFTNGRIDAKIPRKHTAEMLLKRYVPRSLYALAIYNYGHNDFFTNPKYSKGNYGFKGGVKNLIGDNYPYVYQHHATPMLKILRNYCLTDLGQQSEFYGNYNEELLQFIYD